MLVGEAGIGKTWTARTFAAFARERGALVLWGCCFEGDWAPPYGPWIEALGNYTRACDTERLRRELGPAASPLAQLIPEVRTALPDIPLAAPLRPEEERFRLYDAAGQFLLTIAKDVPVVLVLDDLHWAFREAAERFQELLAISKRYGSIPREAEALLQLASCQFVLGDLTVAQQTAQHAREMVARLGSTHRLHVVIGAALASGMAYFLDGDWPALATAASQFIANPEARRSPLGLFVAANAAINNTRAENEAEARRILTALVAVLPCMQPTMYVHNGTVNIAASSVWELAATEFATPFRQLALDLIAAGIGGHYGGSHELTVARMAALLGNGAEASTYFARARTVLETNGQKLLRAIVDYDEALALIHMGSLDRVQIASLLDTALAQFRALDMDAWQKRTLDQQERFALLSRSKSPVNRVYPDGLTPREVEVLRLIAEGKTNKEIAATLIVSIPTAQRHIANIYNKIGARGRADATAYALSHGLAAPRLR